MKNTHTIREMHGRLQALLFRRYGKYDANNKTLGDPPTRKMRPKGSLCLYPQEFFFFIIFRFPDSSLDYYTITVNLIHKKVVCFNSWTISIRVQQSLTTMDYLCRHVRLYFLLDVGTYFDFFNLLVLF